MTIKQIEVEIIDRAFDEGWVMPGAADASTGKQRRRRRLGPGRAGRRPAADPGRARRSTVFERADRIGGLLRYGIPEFKMEKRHLDRRLEQMEAEGTEFRTGVDVGVDVDVDELRGDYDAVVLAGGATQWRDLPIPGRELDGIHQAMEYLPWANRVQQGDARRGRRSTPTGKHVVIIGGGDTGADCLGTAHRQGAASRPPVRDHAPAARRATRATTRGRPTR